MEMICRDIPFVFCKIIWTILSSGELQGRHTMIERAEEGHFDGNTWVFERVWNGDQTDWGLNFTSNPHVLKVKMAAYDP